MGLNCAVLKTKSGFLKLVHVVLGAKCFGIFFGIILYVLTHAAVTFVNRLVMTGEIFFTFLVTFAFLVTSFLLLLSSMLGDAEESNKNVFEILYHAAGSGFQMSAGIALLLPIYRDGEQIPQLVLNLLYHSTVACLFINSVAYLASSIIAYRLRLKTEILKYEYNEDLYIPEKDLKRDFF